MRSSKYHTSSKTSTVQYYKLNDSNNKQILDLSLDHSKMVNGHPLFLIFNNFLIMRVMHHGGGAVD